MVNGKSTLTFLGLIASLVVLLLLLYMVFVGDNSRPPVDFTIHKKLAGELADNNLYRAAIDEYQKILDFPSVEPETRANINYMIGKIFFEDLRDYENAAAYYIKARSLNPEGSFFDEAGKNLIACLERMGRMLDAKRELDKSVNIDSVYAGHEGETVVAKIGDMPVFLSDIEENIQNLPPQMQKDFMSRENKLEALNVYIGAELIYRAAIREGLDNNPEIARLTEQLIKQALVDRYLNDNVISQIKMDETDIRNYFQANKDGKYADKQFDEIKEQVYREYQQEKARQAFQEYVSKLAAVENVQVFEEKIK